MKYILNIIFIACLSVAYSQKEDYNWVIPRKIHVDFNSNPPIVDTVPNKLVVYNCASISDRNGNLLFYLDAKKIYNYKNELIFTLPGWFPATKSFQVIPHPTIDKNFFYITTIRLTLPRIQILYLIDMNANSGYGKVTETSIIYKEEYFKHKFLITRKCNSNNYWFLGFKDNRVIRSTINESGFKNDISVKDFMKVHRVKISPDMSKLVITNYKRNKFYIADYDCKTAEITNIQQFSEDNNISGKPRFFEFSRNSNYLFYTSSSIGMGEKIGAVKYDMSKINNIKEFINSADTLTIINNSGIPKEKALDASLAPNGKIYILTQSSDYLYAIEENSSVSAGYVLNKKALYLKGNKQGKSLPHYFNYHAGFNCSTECLSATFNYLGMPAQSLQWDLGDGNIYSITNPTHTYAAPGTYTVKLTATYKNGITQTAQKNITVSNKLSKRLVILHN